MDAKKTLLRVPGGGGDVEHIGTPGGAALMAHEIEHMIARGMGRHVTIGAFSAPIVGGGAGTILDQNQPEGAVAVPEGICIRPFRLSAQVESALAVADNEENEILFAVDSKGMWTGDGTFTTENPSNLRTTLGIGSACRVGSAFTGDMTTTQPGIAGAEPVLDMELARAVEKVDFQGTPATAVMQRLDLLYEPRYAPYLVGPCTLLIYWGGTVATIGGFSQLSWVEGRTEDFFYR